MFVVLLGFVVDATAEEDAMPKQFLLLSKLIRRALLFLLLSELGSHYVIGKRIYERLMIEIRITHDVMCSGKGLSVQLI